LRDAGHDVTWMRTLVPGLPDAGVLATATTERRVVVTFDKDFGSLVF
jgi:predicted nuclease of predicted toxin-antitoxin system